MADPSSEVFVRGIEVDAETRCAHWHSSLDIIAIKFKCCGEWYSCYECHRALAGHDTQVWTAEQFTESAIFCGACRSKMSITEYLSSDATCPRCRSSLNPGCANHYDLYFEIDPILRPL